MTDNEPSMDELFARALAKHRQGYLQEFSKGGMMWGSWRTDIGALGTVGYDSVEPRADPYRGISVMRLHLGDCKWRVFTLKELIVPEPAFDILEAAAAHALIAFT